MTEDAPPIIRSIIIDGQVYKRLVTYNGKYSKTDRNKYMKAYRLKQKLNNKT
jgi:hypothetical protein